MLQSNKNQKSEQVVIHPLQNVMKFQRVELLRDTVLKDVKKAIIREEITVVLIRGGGGR